MKVGDYADLASSLTAFQGIDVLYFVSGGDDEQRAQLHQNVPIQYIAPDVATFETPMSWFGLPHPVIDILKTFSAAIA